MKNGSPKHWPSRRPGAETIAITVGDVCAALRQEAGERNVTRIIVGKPERRRWQRSLADELIAQSGDVDIYLVLPIPAARRSKEAVSPPDRTLMEGEEWLAAAGIMLLPGFAGCCVSLATSYPSSKFRPVILTKL